MNVFFLEKGDLRKTTINGLNLRMERILEYFEAKPKPRNSEKTIKTKSKN